MIYVHLHAQHIKAWTHIATFCVMFFTCVSTSKIVAYNISKVERDCMQDCNSACNNFRMDNAIRHSKEYCTHCYTMCAGLNKGQALTIKFLTCIFLPQNVLVSVYNQFHMYISFKALIISDKNSQSVFFFLNFQGLSLPQWKF